MNLLQKLLPQVTETVWERIDNNTVRVTATSIFSGKRTSMVLPINEDQEARYKTGGELIQNVFSNLSGDQREFLMSGANGDDWDTHVPEEEE